MSLELTRADWYRGIKLLIRAVCLSTMGALAYSKNDNKNVKDSIEGLKDLYLDIEAEITKAERLEK